MFVILYDLCNLHEVCTYIRLPTMYNAETEQKNKFPFFKETAGVKIFPFFL